MHVHAAGNIVPCRGRAHTILESSEPCLVMGGAPGTAGKRARPEFRFSDGYMHSGDEGKIVVTVKIGV